MKHLLRGREVTVAVVSGIAATLAAGAFGLSAATAGDPPPIELDAGSVQPVAPVPLDPSTTPATTEPTIVRPAEAEVAQPTSATTQASSPSVDSTPSPVSAVSAASAPSPASPATTASPASANSPDSPASAPSAGSIDS